MWKTSFVLTAVLVASAASADAQAGGDVADAHTHMQMAMEDTTAPRWQWMQDGVVYGLFNRQGGPRGGREGVVPNWWMGMLTREQGRHRVGVNAMFSLDPATVGRRGYGEIFQVGETLDGQPLVDRQHPHDFFMQLSALWQVTAGSTAVVVAGGPVGEPTLGPIAFMHRASAAGLPPAPLGHHTFDSTHVSFGVVAASVDRGRWTMEGSVFNGREPDEHRWDLDLGRMDSIAARVWFRPRSGWEAQVSTGRLRDPEVLEPGDAERTTTSLSWFRSGHAGFAAATVGYGVNAAHGDRRHGGFAEFTVERDGNGVFGRVEAQQVETSALLGDHPPGPNDGHLGESVVTAATVGVSKRLVAWRGFDGALGGDVTLYAVPHDLVETHGRRPVSAQAYFRLRLPDRGMGRMWGMRMMRATHAGAMGADHTMP